MTERVFLLVQMDLASGVVRATTWDTTVDWNGFDWVGLGLMGAVDEITDGLGDITGLKFALKGVEQDSKQMALAENVRWRRVTVWRGKFEDRDDGDFIERVDRVWTGVLDALTLSESADGAVVTVTAEHIGHSIGRPRLTRYTNADQMRIHGDPSLAGIEHIGSRRIEWGKA